MRLVIIFAVLIMIRPTTDWNMPIAVALANCALVMPALYTKVDSTSLKSRTMELPRMKGLSKLMFIIWPMLRIKRTTMVVRMPGSVTCQICCILLAPSMRAASNSSMLMPVIADR